MKKSIAVVLAIAFALALFASCTRKGYNYNTGQFVAQDINYNSGQFVAVNNNYNLGTSAVQAHNYYFGPYVSVVTGTLTSKTIITTERRGNSAAYLYMLNTANPINISKVNIPDDSDVITANNITAFELAVCNMNLSAYIGSQVRVTGQFSLRDYGNDSTRAVMDVSKLEIYNTAPVSQCPPTSWCAPPQYTLPASQGKTQGGTQINTQINAQGNAQVNAQINIQSNTQNSTQTITQSKAQSVSKPAPAAKKQPPKKTATVKPCPPPKAKTYRIQVGAFCNPANAQRVVARLQCQNLNPVKEKYLQYTRVVLKGIPANRVDTTVAAVKRAGFCDFWKQPE
jgi:cell division septation protein DedD